MLGFTRRGMVVGAGALVLADRANAHVPPPPNPEQLHESITPLKRFVGVWEGKGGGEPGTSTVARIYEPALVHGPALQGRFLMVTTISTYAPQEKNPKGEVHEDIGYFSFDRMRKRFILRQFNAEGFVNQFVATAED